MKLVRYIQGTRKGKEAHGVERDALVDPFLAEALEGFESVDGNHTERIERMRQQLATRTQKKRRSPTMWIAAAVLLALFTTGGYLWLVKEQPTPQMAVVAEKASITKEVASEENTRRQEHEIAADAREHSETDLNQGSQIADEATASSHPPRSTPTQTIPSPVAPVLPEVPLITEEVLALAEVEINNDTDNLIALESKLDSSLGMGEVKNVSESQTGDLFAYNKDASKQNISGATGKASMKKFEAHGSNAGNYDPNALSQWQINSQGKVGGMLADKSTGGSSSRAGRKKSKEASSSPSSSYYRSTPLSGNIKGQVVDQNGEPLPFANVQVKGSTIATTTDMDGYFALNAKNAEKLVATYIGFDAVELPADSSKTMTIAMNESASQLEEMVVVAYGLNRVDDYRDYQSTTTPQPEAGYTAYRKYLSDSMIKPSDECASVTGRVVLSFYVNNSGRPYNIEVKKGLCSSADKEAIRLVENGGRWTAGDGQVRLTIKF